MCIRDRDYTKEKGEALFDKTVDMMKDAGEILGKTGAKVLDKVDDLWEKKPETPYNQKITDTPSPVSYTHLDVYKRQVLHPAPSLTVIQ